LCRCPVRVKTSTKYTKWYTTQNSITKQNKENIFINTLYKLEKYNSNNNNNKLTQKQKIIINKIISVVEPQRKEKQKYAPKIPYTKIPNYTYQNKKLLLRCGDIEHNPGPKFNLLLNHPQSHQVKHKTYFYKNTTQIKIEYAHIFESFEPYLNQTLTNTINQQLTQFCMNNHHCPKNQLFYAILITLVPTPI
jgi:hypothetical protein